MFFPFSLPIAGNNCIHHRRAIKLSFMNPSEVDFMQIWFSCFSFSYERVFSMKPDKSKLESKWIKQDKKKQSSFLNKEDS